MGNKKIVPFSAIVDDVDKCSNDDEWESYIRGAGVSTAMFDYAKRWYEYSQDCKKDRKRGGSRFSEFALARFGLSQPTASIFVKIGENYAELIGNANKFAPDYTTLYQFTKLEDEQKQNLLSSIGAGELIDRKMIKSLAYGHEEGDEWYTPKWLFDSLGLTFDIDVCAPIDLTNVTTPAKKFFNVNDDGLNKSWKGTIWCNPPYSAPEPWALKCVEHNDGLLLTHIPMNAEWCTVVWNFCSAIRLFQAIEFVRPDGKVQRPGSWLQLAAFGDTAHEALSGLLVPTEVAQNPRRVPSPMWIKA